MKPKILPVLEMAISNGALYGVRRAFKHLDDPSDEQIAQAVCDAVWTEIHEWFDMETVVEE